MLQAQGIVFMLALVALGFSPMVYRWAKRRDQADAQRRELTGPEAVARHLYGQAYNWAPDAMADYDELEAVRDPWLGEAYRRLAESRQRVA